MATLPNHPKRLSGTHSELSQLFSHFLQVVAKHPVAAATHQAVPLLCSLRGGKNSPHQQVVNCWGKSLDPDGFDVLFKDLQEPFTKRALKGAQTFPTEVD